MKALALPSVERLREVLSYDPDTGELRWRITLSNAAVAGRIAGGVNNRGYRLIRVDGRTLRACRVAWAIHTGVDPAEKEIDHINRVRTDDAIKNLRLSNRKQNCENIGTPKHNTSGVRGVSMNQSRGRWSAYIYHHKKRIHLGYFSTLALARLARENAEAVLFHSITAPKEQK